MGNKSSRDPSVPGVLTVSSRSAEKEVHPEIAKLDQLKPSQPILTQPTLDNSGIEKLDPSTIQSFYEHIHDHFAIKTDEILFEQHDAPERMRRIVELGHRLNHHSLMKQCHELDVLNAELDQLPELHHSIQSALAQMQRALIGVESVRRMVLMSEPEDSALHVESFGEFCMRQGLHPPPSAAASSISDSAQSHPSP